MAPVAIFAYARPDHLRRTVESLLANAEAPETDIYVFCDAPRRTENQVQVDAVRAYVDSINGFRSITRLYRDKNFGLAKSIISGVQQVLETHDRLIVMEDDLFVSPHFLRYMNDGLNVYAQDAQVASIHGYCYPVKDVLPETFFIRGADCWGWATWRRAWQVFEPNGRVLLDALKSGGLAKAFDMHGAYPYVRMLKDQIVGRNDSWAIRWHAACFLKDMLTLYPGRSLVENIGIDGSGTHCGSTGYFQQSTSHQAVSVERVELKESEAGAAAFRKFLSGHTSFSARLKNAVRRRLKWLIRT